MSTCTMCAKLQMQWASILQIALLTRLLIDGMLCRVSALLLLQVTILLDLSALRLRKLLHVDVCRPRKFILKGQDMSCLLEEML